MPPKNKKDANKGGKGGKDTGKGGKAKPEKVEKGGGVSAVKVYLLIIVT